MDKETRTLVKEIDPLVSILDIEGELLKRTAQKCKGEVVEIGSWKGRSTIWIARGLKEPHKVYAVDPHETGEVSRYIGPSLQDFKSNLEKTGVASRVLPLIMTSKEALKETPPYLGLVFLDGDHSIKGVYSDFLFWRDRIQLGGFLALHDTVAWEGPKTLLKKTLQKRPEWVLVAFIAQLVILKKVQPSLSKSCLNSVMFILKDLHDSLFTLVASWPSSLKGRLKKFI